MQHSKNGGKKSFIDHIRKVQWKTQYCHFLCQDPVFTEKCKALFFFRKLLTSFRNNYAKKKANHFLKIQQFETYTYTIFSSDFFRDKNFWIFKSQSSAEEYFKVIIQRSTYFFAPLFILRYTVLFLTAKQLPRMDHCCIYLIIAFKNMSFLVPYWIKNAVKAHISCIFKKAFIINVPVLWGVAGMSFPVPALLSHYCAIHC